MDVRENERTTERQSFLQTLQEMWRVRLFEEEVTHLFNEGKIYGTFHLSSGEEACAVGACSALSKDDKIISTHRNHGHGLAKGTDMTAMFAEMMARVTGTNKGKGGSMHIADVSVGNLGGNGIVGAGFPLATGAALAQKMKNENSVTVCFAGDGATGEGSFHEALNLASIWKLPVIFFIENNHYAMSSKASQMIAVKRISERANSYDMRGITIDGNDVLKVQKAVAEAKEAALAGEGPTLIEALTYRHNGHSKSDKIVYRTQEECDNWKRLNDPIARFEQFLIDEEGISVETIEKIHANVYEEVKKCSIEAQKSDFPDASELTQDVYAKEAQHA
jgi:pyruvate dehydrogenase E1 component alpha subunit